MNCKKTEKRQSKHGKMNLHSYFIPFTKDNSCWITNLKVKAKTMKLLEENTGQ